MNETALETEDNMNEHYRNWFGQIVGTLIVAGVIATMVVWSDTRQNSRDIVRHETTLNSLQGGISDLQSSNARIEEALKGLRRE